MKNHIVDTEIYVKKFILEYSDKYDNNNILRSMEHNSVTLWCMFLNMYMSCHMMLLYLGRAPSEMHWQWRTWAIQFSLEKSMILPETNNGNGDVTQLFNYYIFKYSVMTLLQTIRGLNTLFIMLLPCDKCYFGNYTTEL